MMEQPISKKAMRIELENMPKGAIASVNARVDYDGNFFWTYDSQKYEYALKDYGISPEGYRFGDKVKVFIDDEQNAIQVTTVEEGLDARDKDLLVGSVIALLVPILLITCVYMPIAYSTFGKPWREFIREFEGK